MKYVKLLILSFCLVIICGCSYSSNTPLSDESEIVYITEKMFVSLNNDIYINPEEYVGKTIRYEGMYIFYEGEDYTYHYVIRYGPGCCGTDADCGFEVVWDGEWPQYDDWVEITGVLEEYEEDDCKYLRINLTDLKVLEERGAEYVYQ